MSFTKLKEFYVKHEAEISQMDAYKQTFLACLFEMNGNLDTIALCMRAHVEHLDFIKRELEKHTELNRELIQVQREAINVKPETFRKSKTK